MILLMILVIQGLWSDIIISAYVHLGDKTYC